MIQIKRGLYAITDGPRADLLDAVQAALAGGARIVQYRDKTSDHPRRAAEARQLVELCRNHDVPLIVNDDVELARATGADGVHLGEDDADIAAARAILGVDAIIGISCYDSIERARLAAAAGTSYVAFGAFYPSLTKPDARRANLDLLRMSHALGIPRVAIGGITHDNAPALIAAGADLLAVITGVFGASDIHAAAQGYADLFSLPHRDSHELKP